MLTDFDLHAGTNHLAVRHSDLSGRMWIVLHGLGGQPLGEIAHTLLPLAPRWSPDGSSVAFASNDGLLYLYDLQNATIQAAFEDPALVAGFCEWSPDGERLVFSAYERDTGAPPDIYCLHLCTRQMVKLTDSARQVDRFPQWSPSGQYVAFTRQHLDESERPKWICVVDVGSRSCFQLPVVPEPRCRIGRFSWSSDSRRLLVFQTRKEATKLQVVDLLNRTVAWTYEKEKIEGAAFSPADDRMLCGCHDELLWISYPDDRLLDRLSLAPFAPVKDALTGPNIGFDTPGRTVYFLGTDSRLYSWSVGGECKVLVEEQPQHKPAFTHDKYLVSSRDGYPVPVERFIPFHPRRPAILYVHGGPAVSIDPDDSFMLRLLAEGYEFVCAAYRGSAGYGPEHQEANQGVYGRVDVWDVIACGLDWKERIGGGRPLIIMGFSYGGFLTLLALAQGDTVWDGGVALWPLLDLQRLGAHAHRSLPSDPGERAAALIERSPLEQAQRIRAPLLVFYGALDTMAAIEKVLLLWQRIRSAGGACETVIFEDDTHGLRRHRDEIHARVLAFLEEFQDDQAGG